MAWKECVICGASFFDKNTTKTCSKKCKDQMYKDYKRYWSRRKHGIKDTKQCGYCGNSFHFSRANKYCCEDCKVNASKEKKVVYYLENRELMIQKQRERYQNKRAKWKNCAYCGGKFFPVDKRIKVCSDICSEKSRIRSILSYSLNTEPPADLVEEATALRLLNRALKETKNP